MKKLIFLVSGQGGNLTFTHRAIDLGLLPGGQIALDYVIADRPCGALDYAQSKHLNCAQINYSRQAPSELQDLLRSRKPDLIVTNIHKILDAQTVGEFAPRLINLHYSLLPLFGGAIGEEPVRQALAAGCGIIGTTVHFVSEKLDAGEIISQSAIPVVKQEPFEALMGRVFRSGCLNLLCSIKHLLLNPDHLELAPLNQQSSILGSAKMALTKGDSLSEQEWLRLMNPASPVE